MLTYGELLVCIGICLIMATIQGFQCHGFDISITIDTFEMDPYRFNYILAWKRYKEIIKSLRITDKTPPPCKDQFLEERKNIYLSML